MLNCDEVATTASVVPKTGMNLPKCPAQCKEVGWQLLLGTVSLVAFFRGRQLLESLSQEAYVTPLALSEGGKMISSVRKQDLRGAP